ncbi:MAG: hypothetical protein HY291_02840 [Planctomycetes bacterium]|nr:hypothetical protein [Planctomycetota bacterium]
MKAMKESSLKGISANKLLALASRNTVLVTHNGKPGWALVPLNGRDWESYVVSRSPVFKRAMGRSRNSIKTGRGLSLAEVKKRYGIK